MRIALIALPLILASAGCSASNAGASGVSGSRTYPTGAFDSVSLAGPDNVIVRVGGPASVVAQGDTGVLDRLTVEVVGSQLRIGREKSGSFGIGWGKGGRPVTVTVTVPALHAASVAGSGNMDVDKVTGDAFDGSVAGSGILNVASIKTGTVSLSIAGSGDAKVAGTARSAKYRIAGSGGVDAAALTVTDASMSVAGSGNIKAGATGSAAVSVTGSGNVDVTGGAKCSISKTGSGDVNCA